MKNCNFSAGCIFRYAIVFIVIFLYPWNLLGDDERARTNGSLHEKNDVEIQKEILNRLDRIEDRLQKDQSTFSRVINIGNKVLIPGLLALIALVTYLSSKRQTDQQIKLLEAQEKRQGQKERFERGLQLQQLYIEYITSDNDTQKNAAILLLRLMERNEVIQLANWANYLELTRPQRCQILEILCEAGGMMGCPYTIIKGFFIRVSDGDSISFQAQRDSNWLNIEDPQSLGRKDSEVKLRLVGIDALELNSPIYRTSGNHQKWAEYARDQLSYLLGIPKQLNDKSRARRPGFIAVEAVDPYKRAVALAFPRSADLKDGTVVYLTPELVKMSVNYALLESGFVYPYFFTDLPDDVTNFIRQTVKEARNKSKGLWSEDETESFEVSDKPDAPFENVVLPLLIRYLARYVRKNNHLENLKYFPPIKEREVLNFASGEINTLDNYLDIEGNTIRFKTKPEDLKFIS